MSDLDIHLAKTPVTSTEEAEACHDGGKKKHVCDVCPQRADQEYEGRYGHEDQRKPWLVSSHKDILRLDVPNEAWNPGFAGFSGS